MRRLVRKPDICKISPWILFDQRICHCLEAHALVNGWSQRLSPAYAKDTCEQSQIDMQRKEAVSSCTSVNPLVGNPFLPSKRSWGRKGDTGNDANPSALVVAVTIFLVELNSWLPPLLYLCQPLCNNLEECAGY
jgi:hypothetical protein